VNKDYLKYTIEDLILDKEFIEWIRKGNFTQEEKVFLTSHPELKFKINKAKEIIALLNDDNQSLKDADILMIWKNIENFEKHNENKTSRIVNLMYKFSRYAAILILVLIVGGVIRYYLSEDNNQSYEFSATVSDKSNDQSQIILADGTTINLNQEESKIALNSEKQMVIENENVIDLNHEDFKNQIKMNEVIIPYGKQSQITLADGTKIWINAGSRLAFPTQFTKNTRTVFLEGEAYFEVAHDDNIPFIVNTEDISVKVYGTKFNLSAYKQDERLETTLLEGKVSVKNRNTSKILKKETFLMPNQKASFNKTDNSIRLEDDPEAGAVIAWVDGWLSFKQEKLTDVHAKLHRFYNVQFEQIPNDLDKNLISGKLDLKDSLEYVLNTLSDVTGLKYKLKNNFVEIENIDPKIKQ